MEPCGPEVATLKHNIKKLENKLFLVTWQIEHFQNYKYFKPLQSSVPKADPESDAGGKEKSNETADSSDMTLIKPLSPAGNLIVYDKGNKSCISCKHLQIGLRLQNVFLVNYLCIFIYLICIKINILQHYLAIPFICCSF